MNFFLRQFKQILLTSTFVLYAVTAMSQVKNKTLASKPVIKRSVSPQLRDFYHLTTDANVVFIYPAGFKEIPVINNDDYQRLKNDPNKQIANPDSLYNDIGRAQASTFTGGDPNYLTRIIPQDI